MESCNDKVLEELKALSEKLGQLQSDGTITQNTNN